MKKKDDHSLGTFLKELRNNKKITQEELAIQLNEKYNLHESRNTISQYENNKRILNCHEILSIFDFFEIPIEHSNCYIKDKKSNCLIKLLDFILDRIYRIINFVYPFILIAFFIVGVIVFCKDQSLGISMIALALSLSIFFNDHQDKFSKKQKNFYVTELDHIKELKQEGFITELEYKIEINKLQASFRKYKNKILK